MKKILFIGLALIMFTGFAFSSNYIGNKNTKKFIEEIPTKEI